MQPTSEAALIRFALKPLALGLDHLLASRNNRAAARLKPTPRAQNFFSPFPLRLWALVVMH